MLLAAVDPAAAEAAAAKSSESDSLLSRLSHLRGVRWRIYLCNLPRSSIDDLRRVTADSRRRYAVLRKRLLVDPHIPKDGCTSPNLVMDNPLSESPDSMWGRFFRNAELEKLLDQDLSRLYPEHDSYFQTLGCQSMLRRILLLWCLRHPEYGYRQGMHELLAPLLYVLHADLQQLSEARKLHEGHFTDKFDDASFQENDLAYNFDFRRSRDFMVDDPSFQEKTKKTVSLGELDPEIQTISLLSDPYGAEGELGVVLSEKFMEHDVYCMFDSLMRGAGGAVAMAEFFSPSTGLGTQTGLSPVIEASSALYHLLSVVDSSLYSHLIELGAEPQYFALRWLRVLFGREFSLEDLLIIWDEIFSFDDVKISTAAEDEAGFSLGVLNSCRGAFICAMAVSMMLNLRSSLLAMETATACLQRLLNFPRNIDLGKLIGKAKSLLPLALDANTPSSYAASGSHGRIKTSVVRGQSLSLASASSTIPLMSAPESYWEEKWRDMHKKEELKKDKSSAKQTPMPTRGWTEKIKSKLYMMPPVIPSKRDGREELRAFISRCVLEQLSNHLGENTEDVRDNESLNQNDPSTDDSVVRPHDVQTMGGIETTFSKESTSSVPNAIILSDAESPAGGSSSLEDDLEKSSVDSDVSHDMNEESQHNGPFHSISEDQHTVSHPSDTSLSPPVSDSPEAAAVGSTSEDRKSFPCKFQWLWKLGGHAMQEEATDEVNAPEVIQNTNEESQTGITVVEPVEEQNGSRVIVKGNVMEQNLINSLRNRGQSMLENIQEAKGGDWLELPPSIKAARASTSTSPSIQPLWPTWRLVNLETEIKDMKSEGYGYLEREETEDESLPSIVPNSEFQSFSTGVLFLYGENYEFEKDKLIQLWIAGGFIENEPMEINGANYFEILKSEGYILRSHADSIYKVNCSMVNSRFNMFSDKSSYLRLESESQNNAATAEILHVSVVDDDMIDTMFKTPDKFDKLRTLLFMGTCSSRLDKVLLELFLNFESLVVLDLSGTDIKELPSSTGKMINLRYLDLSWTFIDLLPKAICRFEGLQTLRLKGCSCLWRLPSEMQRLAKLRHLDFDILGQLAIMPKRIGSLVNLRTLSAFLIGAEEGCKITELRDLNYLAGEFCIARLEHVQSAVDARLASLSAKKHLKKLELRWSDSSLQEKEDEGISNSVLENLRPHSDLEELHIQFYPGTNLPSWIADEAFLKLARVTLFKCEHVFVLFPSMQKLPSLEYLRLISLISVIKLDFGGQMDQCAAFPKLKTLIIDKMLNLETWIESKDGDFPCLAELTIKYCSKLCELPSLVYLSSMKHLEISSCPKVQFVPEKELSLSLEHLMVEDCPLIQESYSKQEGQFLDKIKHVPSVWIDQDDDSELLDDDEHTNGSSDDTEELSQG